MYPEAAIGSSHPLAAYGQLSINRRPSWSSWFVVVVVVRRRPLVGGKFYPLTGASANLIRFTFGLALIMALVSKLHASEIPLLKSFVLEA